MQDHNEYLQQIENYLSDLAVMDRNKILQNINHEIAAKDIKELQAPLTYANIKRTELGFMPYQEKKNFSVLGLFFKLTAVMTLLSFIFFGVLIWKFTPLIKIDEENNRVVLLGGVIDIDGKAGKFKIFDNYHFSNESFSNDLQANIVLDQDKDEIIVAFNAGSFVLSNSESNEFTLDCKLAEPVEENMIQQFEDHAKINMQSISGVTCSLGVPEDKRITLEGKQGSVTVKNAEFNLYIELESGKVSITPEEEIDYNYNLNVKNGYVGEFESSENEEGYEVQINIDQGAVIRK
jgi:hypothetical protein